jgi:asparagine synthase (glutamine-hydrolysing)
MCGFLGYFAQSSRPLLHELYMSKKYIDFRGPDSFGFSYISSGGQVISNYNDNIPKAISSRFGAIHCRLAIIGKDTDSIQPLFYSNKVFLLNGSIYNYLDLRDLYLSDSPFSECTSDTLVLAVLYDLLGDDVFTLLKGCWSLAVMNLSTNTLHLYRDRFGEKPLYFSYSESTVFFGSSLIGVAKLSGHSNVCSASSRFFVHFGSAEKHDQTLIKNVYCVPPGYAALSLDGGMFSLKKYYTINTYSRSLQNKPSCDYISRLLTNSIVTATTCDANVGIPLSGGLDSSNVFLRANQFSRYKGYSAFSDYTPQIELDCIQATGLNKSIQLIKTDEIDYQAIYAHILSLIDIPLHIDTAIIDYTVYSYMSRDGVRVSLSGHGADELFYGYHIHKYYSFFDCIHRLGFTRALKLLAYSLDTSLISALLGAIRVFMMTLVRYSPSQLLNTTRNSSLLCLLQENLMRIDPLYSWLQTTDRLSMLCNIEARSPFLDVQLVDYLTNISISSYRSLQRSKYLLRDSSPMLPSIVTNRLSKTGYIRSSILNTTFDVDFIRPLFYSIDRLKLLNYCAMRRSSLIFNWTAHQSSKSWRVFSLITWANQHNLTL